MAMSKPRTTAVAAFGLSALLGLVFAGPLPAGEILELKSGHTLEGEIIKERADELIIDVGVDILRVPLERIARRRAAGASNAPDQKREHNNGFYTTAELPRSTVRALAARFGEGVVLVKTPAGLGSGFILNKQGYCVTNHHVIENETKISATVYQRNKEQVLRKQIDDVKIIAINPFIDLALLKIPEQKDVEFAPVLLASEDDLRGSSARRTATSRGRSICSPRRRSIRGTPAGRCSISAVRWSA
jgi:serine protease Do